MTVDVRVRGATAEIAAPTDIVASVDRLLSAEVPGARFSTAYKMGRWDGTARLLRGRAFPAGLVHRVVTHLEDFETDVCVHDLTPFLPGEPMRDALIGIELREHQIEAVDIATRERRVLIEMPTSAGKTETGAEVIRRLNGTTLWLTHRTDLAKQTRRRLAERLGVKIGFVGASERRIEHVTVGMVPTLANLVKRRDAATMTYLGLVKVLIIDEAHHAGADTFLRVVEQCGLVSYQIGLSATAPSRDALTDLRVEGATGPKRVVTDVASLAARGFVATPTIRLLEPPKETYPTSEAIRDAVLPSWRRDPRPLQRMGTKLFQEARRRGVVENEPRTRAIASAALRHYRGEERAGGERVMILTELREHAAVLADQCRKLGAEKVWCATGDDPDRESMLLRFRALDPPGIFIATPWFREGMDAPEVDVGFVAGANLSEIAIVQQLGRFLRTRPGKESVLIYFVLDGRDPRDAKDYLAQHTVEQLRIFREKGWGVERFPSPS